MSEPNRHHYLPVFYLNRWAGPDGRVVRYYRPHHDVVASSISPKFTGFEQGLYRLDGYAPEAENDIEKKFMARVVDDPASCAMEALIERDQSNLTPEFRQAWTRFVMSLHVRHPDNVAKITQQAKAGLRQSLLEDPKEYAAVRRKDDPPTLVEWVELNAPFILDNYGKQMLPAIITHQDTGDAILHMRWWTIGIPDDIPDLLTCDRPVFMSHGVSDERCFIALPLAPRFAFFATRSQATFDRVMSRDIKAIAKSINETLVSQAVNNVYGSSQQHHRFVQNRLRSVG